MGMAQAGHTIGHVGTTFGVKITAVLNAWSTCAAGKDFWVGTWRADGMDERTNGVHCLEAQSTNLAQSWTEISMGRLFTKSPPLCSLQLSSFLVPVFRHLLLPLPLDAIHRDT